MCRTYIILDFDICVFELSDKARFDVLYIGTEGIQDGIKGCRICVFEASIDTREEYAHGAGLLNRKHVADEDLQTENHRFRWDQVNNEEIADESHDGEARSQRLRFRLVLECG